MTERPILMNAAMVRATLAGGKTQTRRVLKPQPLGNFLSMIERPIRSAADEPVLRAWFQHEPSSIEITCPYGKPGDRLWVREAHSLLESSITGRAAPVWFWADGEPPEGDYCRPRPSIHMHRWASRILLEVTAVRVERLQSISEADAQAEGCALECMTPTGDDSGSAIHGPGGFMALWESINGPGSWDVNPWLWVVEFRRIAP